MWTSLRSSVNVSTALRRFLRERPVVHGHPGHRFASSFPRQGSFVPFFTRTSKPSHRLFGRRYLWVLPVTGGLTLYYLPRPPSILSSLIASPKVIPVPPSRPEPEPEAIVSLNSPNEENRSLLSRIRHFVLVWIWEPILTTRRFAHLFVIFIPVILASSAIFFGRMQHGKKCRERSGAIWWYGLLVSSLQRAGPTFIKVRMLCVIVIRVLV